MSDSLTASGRGSHTLERRVGPYRDLRGTAYLSCCIGIERVLLVGAHWATLNPNPLIRADRRDDRALNTRLFRS